MSVPRPRDRRQQGSSGARLLAQMGIAVYSIVAAFVIVRSLLLSVGIADNLWVGSVIYGVTDPVASALKLVPGGDFELVARMTLADLTLLATVIAVPVVIVARRPAY
ncbi:hypothetical protein BH24CHL4_BH24CHL4_05610 [soil metagenome]